MEQVRLAARASRNLGLRAGVTFSGALAWPYVYPWPQRPAGLVEAAFEALGQRWRPILDAYEESGIELCFEIYPGEDLHDGVTFERLLVAVGGHARTSILYNPSHFVLQHLDYLAFLDIYHKHIEDAELRYDGRSGVYGGYQVWVERPGSAGMGVRAQAPRGQRAGRRGVHPRPHYPCRQPHPGRFRGVGRRGEPQPLAAGPWLKAPAGPLCGPGRRPCAVPPALLPTYICRNQSQRKAHANA